MIKYVALSVLLGGIGNPFSSQAEQMFQIFIASAIAFTISFVDYWYKETKNK